MQIRLDTKLPARKKDRIQNSDPEYPIHHSLCHIICINYNKNSHKSPLKYEIKYDLYKTIFKFHQQGRKKNRNPTFWTYGVFKVKKMVF